MSVLANVWRLVVFLYSLFLLALSSIAIIAAIGRPEPIEYINYALSTPTNRIMLGLVAIIFFVIALLSIISSFKVEKSIPKLKPNSITVQSTLVGQVSITIPAIKVIIMKAIKTIEGVKEVKSSVSNGDKGLIIDLHIMINPDLNVAEVTKNMQGVVKQYVEEFAGLTVDEVKILVDDFGQNPSS